MMVNSFSKFQSFKVSKFQRGNPLHAITSEEKMEFALRGFYRSVNVSIRRTKLEQNLQFTYRLELFP